MYPNSAANWFPISIKTTALETTACLIGTRAVASQPGAADDCSSHCACVQIDVGHLCGAPARLGHVRCWDGGCVSFSLKIRTSASPLWRDAVHHFQEGSGCKRLVCSGVSCAEALCSAVLRSSQSVSNPMGFCCCAASSRGDDFVLRWVWAESFMPRFRQGLDSQRYGQPPCLLVVCISRFQSRC